MTAWLGSCCVYFERTIFTVELNIFQVWHKMMGILSWRQSSSKNNVTVWTKILKMSTFHTTLVLCFWHSFWCPVATGKETKSHPVCSTCQHLNMIQSKQHCVIFVCFKVHFISVKICHLWIDKLQYTKDLALDFFQS